MSDVFLEVRNATKRFSSRRRGQEPVVAVDGVSLQVRRGERCGLVGESGSGKTTVARAILGLIELTEGEIRIDGQIVRGRSEPPDLHRMVQLVFQDPYGSLDPRQRVGEALAEPLRVHRIIEGEDAVRDRVRELLAAVDLEPDLAQRLPRGLSGGQRQRVAIARALSVDPELLVMDEPTSSLDISTQARILELLEDLQEQLGLAYLFITHDLNLCAFFTQRVAVMQEGKLVEQGETERIFRNPQHPYTKALLGAVLTPDRIGALPE